MAANADHNLLFGILALQNNFINREQLLAAFDRWVLDKTASLAQILHEQKALAAERRQLLEALVAEHLKQHNNDPEQSLAAVQMSSWLGEQIKSLCHPDLQPSIGHLASLAPLPDDPEATRSHSVGEASVPTPKAASARFRSPSTANSTAKSRSRKSRSATPTTRPAVAVSSSKPKLPAALNTPGIVPVYGH